MKFPPHQTATAFRHPALRGWIIAFACGFFTICIIGPVVCLGLWLLEMGATAINLTTVPAILAVSTPVAARIILQVATAFGAVLATLSVYEAARRKRREVRVPGHHPIMGDFEQLPYFTTWHANPMLPTGQTVNLNGQGSSPSDSQVALWQQFIARYDTLIDKATRALLTAPHPLEECSSVTLTPSGITIAKDGSLYVGLQFTTVPDILWTTENETPIPFVIFTPSLELEKAQWVAPYEA